MTCREFADFMADYVSGELLPEAKALFERHLSECDTCVTYLKDYQAAIRLGRQAYDTPHAPVPEAVPEALVKAILAARPGTG